MHGGAIAELDWSDGNYSVVQRIIRGQTEDQSIAPTGHSMPVGIHRYNDHGRHPNERIGY